MAERRMFAKTIVDSDAFLDMPMSARLLYYDLGMRADDDGFVNSPKKIMRMVGASEDDINILILRKFIIPFSNGIVVIKHWKIHNYIRNDRYKPTTYVEEKSQLSQDKNNAYTLNYDNVDTNGIPMVSVLDTQDSIGKDSIGKVNISISNDIDCQTDAVRQVISAWNTLSEFGVKPVSKMASTSTRYKSLVARIKQYSLDDILRAIDNIKDSDFLTGKSTDWIITFDWFVKPNNFVKVLDGNYNNRTGSGSSTVRY